MMLNWTSEAPTERAPRSADSDKRLRQTLGKTDKKGEACGNAQSWDTVGENG